MKVETVHQTLVCPHCKGRLGSRTFLCEIAEAPETAEPELSNDQRLFLKFRINTLGVPCRLVRALEEEGIYTVGDLAKRSEREVFRIRDIGRKSLVRVKARLAEMGLSLRNPEVKP